MLTKLVLIVILASIPGIMLELQEPEATSKNVSKQITPELWAYGPGGIELEFVHSDDARTYETKNRVVIKYSPPLKESPESELVDFTLEGETSPEGVYYLQ